MRPRSQGSGRFRASIGFKLASATVVILLVAASAASYLLLEHERRELFERKEQATVRVAEQLALALTAPLEFDDDLAVAEALRGISEDPELVYLRVIDRDRPVDVGIVGEDVPTPVLERDPPAVSWADDALWVAWPIRDEAAGDQGTLVIALSIAREQAGWTRQRDLILGGCLGLSLLVALSLVAAARKMVLLPLSRLAGAAEAFGRGQPVVVPSGGGDEVGRLAQAFAAMMAAIAERERRLADAHAEVGRLLDAMRQAVFGFGPDLMVVGRCSRATARLFRRDDIAGVDVRELLLAGQPEGSPEATATLEFLDLVFTLPPDAWAEVLDLAPRELCLHPDTPDERELVLEFLPLRDGDELVRVMVVVTDETDARRTQREMKHLEDRHSAELATTRRLLGMGAHVFVEFSTAMATRMECVGDLLREPSRSRIDEVLRKVHAVRGDARALGLLELARTLTLAESVVAEARDSVDPPPPDRWTAELRLHMVQAAADLARARQRLIAASPLGEDVLLQVTVSARDLDELGALRDQGKPALVRCIDRVRSRMLGALLTGLDDAVGAWAASESKRVRFDIEATTTRIDAAVATGLRTVIVQLVRNAVAHGIERPEVREAAGKPAVGSVRIVAEASDDGPTLEVIDDGAGFDFIALAASARERGLVSAPALLPFVDGVSTRARADSLAGRGVGLSAAREELAALGYTIAIESTPGVGTRIRIFPAANQPSQNVASIVCPSRSRTKHP